MFEMTQEELIALNPELNNGVEIGMLLRILLKPAAIGDKGYKSCLKNYLR
jgi:hypothetical protein